MCCHFACLLDLSANSKQICVYFTSENGLLVELQFTSGIFVRLEKARLNLEI